MDIIRASTLTSSPWKNGGGETTEIAVWPPGASLDTFDWRISMATVERDGPFSVFPGVDRTLAVLKGGLKLKFRDRPAAVLTPGSTPVSFPGDIAVTGELGGGPARDLNVMTRRGVWAHDVRRVDKSLQGIDESITLPTSAAWQLLVVTTGLAEVEQIEVMDPMDTLLLPPSSPSIKIVLERAAAYVVTLAASPIWQPSAVSLR